MTEIWGHRGAPAYAPENTLPSFELALEHGVDGVEFDVQRSADGVLVVVHDESISRTSNGVGRVPDLTYEELRRCDFSNGFVGFRNTRIPTLRETLELLGSAGVRINIELKNGVQPYPGMELEVLELVQEMELLDRVVISSFNHVSLAALRTVVPPENLGLLYAAQVFDPWRYAQYFGAGAIHPYHLVLDQPDFMWLCHEAGIRVHTWTADEDKDVEHLTRIGVDAIITNLPDRARRVSRRTR